VPFEVGLGLNFNTRFIAQNGPGCVATVKIPDAAFAAFANTRDMPNCHVIQADLTKAPFGDKTFDFVVANRLLQSRTHQLRGCRGAIARVEVGRAFRLQRELCRLAQA
jgi:hypothetical protein